MGSQSIAIIGAGFSGTLLALHLLRRCPPSTRIALIERNSRFGLGQAYATVNPSHLLNVPAGRMGAFHDDPGGFLTWLQTHQAPCQHTAQSFVSRQLFGDYIRHLLTEEIRRGTPGRERVELVRANVTSLTQDGGEIVLELDKNRVLRANTAVLAVGNFPPAPPYLPDSTFYNTPLYRADPWAADATAGLAPAAPVAIIGTGLSMVDTVISLLDQGHTGPVHAISRRGLLPRCHGASAPFSDPAPVPAQLRALTRYLRRSAARRAARGESWHAVIDSLRPYSQDIWQSMTEADRARFLRHLRPWWEVHRHRIAPEVSRLIDAARAGGQLHVHAGRINAYTANGDGTVTIGFMSRGKRDQLALTASRVINCAGPNADYARMQDPLVRCLLVNGAVRPDKLRLGLDVTPACALLTAEGAIHRNLFAAGPVTKGAFWEITAVPDLRRQCETLASHIASLAGAAPVVAKPARQETPS
jgi:uncharacterized NAD(P)/FAD-binding protein YdhS